MKRILSLLAAAACMSAITYASDIFGSWNGKLQVTPQVALNLVFHIEEDNLAPHGPGGQRNSVAAGNDAE